MKSRRIFIKDICLLSGGLLASTTGLMAFASDEEDRAQQGKDKGKGGAKKLGIALVGLGKYSEEQLAPALKETAHCKLTGIVTGTPSKAEKWKKKYDIPDKNVYSYQNFDTIKDNKDIDIIYVVLPNALHAEYVIRAAKAGKHVICEKPMAVSVEECERMIKACKEANVMLSIGYRLHFEPFNVEMMRLGNDKVFGEIKSIKADNGMKLPSGTWRATKALAGGGPLMDVGIYCVQAAIYTMGMNPIAVTAKEGPKTDLEKFKDVEESITWELEFPGGVKAVCRTSYNEQYDLLRADAENGWFELSPAFAYTGKKGKTSKGAIDKADMYEQVQQMDDFAKCVLNKQQTRVPGEMGLRDVKVLMAIYEAARTGKKVPLEL